MTTYDDIKIVVDGVELPAPISINYNLEDLDKDTQRDVKTLRIKRNRGLSDLHKLSITYAINDTAAISAILKAIKPETFEVELFDLTENKRATKTMYAGSKSAEMLVCDNVWVKGMKFNIIEV